jgi:glucose dehydrogenase
MRIALLVSVLIAGFVAAATHSTLADVRQFTPVTQKTLARPRPDDWLTFSRICNAQHFSSLKQIHTQHVGRLGPA